MVYKRISKYSGKKFWICKESLILFLEGGQKTRTQAVMPRVKTVFVEFLYEELYWKSDEGPTCYIVTKNFPHLLFLPQWKAELKGHKKVNMVEEVSKHSRKVLTQLC